MRKNRFLRLVDETSSFRLAPRVLVSLLFSLDSPSAFGTAFPFLCMEMLKAPGTLRVRRSIQEAHRADRTLYSAATT